MERYQQYGAIIIPAVSSQNEIVNQLLGGEIDAFGEGDVSNAFLGREYKIFLFHDMQSSIILSHAMASRAFYALAKQ